MSPAILRIIDVNFNRVREALRVLEDFARFHEDDASLSAALKALRHDFQSASAALQARAVTARDTAGDVGTGITTETEQKRESLAAVVTAAGKRLGEALRTIEEYAKLFLAQELNAITSSATSGSSAVLGGGWVGAAADAERRGNAEMPSGSSPSGGGGVGAADAIMLENAGFRLLDDNVNTRPLPPPNLPREGRNQKDADLPSSAPTSSVAARIEQLRYRWYDLEKSILMRFTPGRERMAGVRLHVLITESLCRRPWLETAELAIAGGADVLQLREKTLESGELLARAKALVDLCRHRGVICVINDRPDIALLAGAHGVHVGQADLPLAEVRKLVGPGLIVGVSTHAIDQAVAAAAGGADYIGVGPIFPSTTKPQPHLISLSGLAYPREAAALAAARGLPTVGISGITAANAADARATGLSAVAVSSAVCAAADPAAAAAAIRATMT